MSFDDAQTYVRWLNAKVAEAGGDAGAPTEGPYRLPTLGEAKYAAAGETETSYPWGETPSRSNANYGADRCSPCAPTASGHDRWVHTSPVGSFPPNNFGLYDTSGNVWQWTTDCLRAVDPDRLHGDDGCPYAVLHGGSWIDTPDYLSLSAYRVNLRVNRNNTIGFRVVRDLPPRISVAEGGSRASSDADARRAVAAQATAGQATAGQVVTAAVPGTATQTFRDCRGCPLMVALPAGVVPLTQFSAATGIRGGVEPVEANGTAVKLIVAPFAVGLYHITRDEYGRFVEETEREGGAGCQRLNPAGFWVTDASLSWRHPGFAQTGRDPVVCVSWDDARAYLNWLNGKVAHESGVSGAPYRLMSGAEWQYASRAGSENITNYYWGNDPGHDRAKYGGEQCFPCAIVPLHQGHAVYPYTTPVGSFPPNDFGLYDMVGNAWQFSSDCVGTDPSLAAKNSAMCEAHKVYGGAYHDRALTLYITIFGGEFYNDIRNNANGFRVVRDMR